MGGVVVAIEGQDSAGKATHSKLLAEKLGGTRFSFPNYASPTGQAIQGHLKKHWSVQCAPGSVYANLEDRVDAFVFQSLQTVNRIEAIPRIVEAMERGSVVFDRYTASQEVYGVLDGLDREWLRRISNPLPEPDVWILLDIPVEEGFRRRPERRDRYEVDRNFMEKVRQGYLRLFGEHKGGRWLSPRDRWQEWYVIDAVGSIQEVHARIVEAVSRYHGPVSL